MLARTLSQVSVNQVILGWWGQRQLRYPGLIAGVFRENKRAEVQAIGASAINQAVKAMALARGYLSNDGFDIIFFPEFVDVQIEDKVRTAIKFTVEAR